MAGSAIIFGASRNAPPIEKAFEYWRRALHLRLMDTEGFSQIPKITRIQTKGMYKEWATSDELDHLLGNPSEHKFQAHLARLRIFSEMSFKTFKVFFRSYLYHVILSIPEPFTLRNLSVMLETLLHCFDPLAEEGVCDLTLEVIGGTGNVPSHIQKRSPELLLNDVDTFKIFLEMLILATNLFRSTNSNGVKNGKIMYSILTISRVMQSMPVIMNDEEIIKPFIELVIRQDWKNIRGETLLHIACIEEAVPETVRLLLEAGTDPNAGDENGDGPLHFLAASRTHDEVMDSTAHLLLNYGTHLDRVNKNGKTAAEIWVENQKWRNGKEDVTTTIIDLPDWCREDIPKLSCLSARIISFHKIAYTEKLPASLHSFVKMH